jgi:hypothetical protein
MKTQIRYLTLVTAILVLLGIQWIALAESDASKMRKFPSENDTMRCNNCWPEYKPLSISLAEKYAKKGTDTLIKRLKNTTLDNPEDSTTERVQYIYNLSMTSNMYQGQDTIFMKHFWPVFLEIVKKEPYPQIRAALVNYMMPPSGPKKDKYSVLTQMLSDPHIVVRVLSASRILTRCTYDSIIPDPLAVKIVKDAAIGIGRSNWNVKGFYTKAEFDTNPGIVEKWRDFVQGNAADAINYYIMGSTNGKGSASGFFDSAATYGTTEEIRASAKHGNTLMH